MKITAITATPVSIPTTRPCAWSQGKGHGFSRTIVQIETDRGAVGLGETADAGAAQIINQSFAPVLIGLDIANRVEAQSRCLNGQGDFGQLANPLEAKAFVAIEMALWDLLGKRASLPLYQLLGGARRKRAVFGGYAYTVDLDQGFKLADVADEMTRLACDSIASSGSRLFEFKVGRHGVDVDIETVLAVRSAVGSKIALGVDANMGYSYEEARYFLKHTASVLDFVEEPVASLSQMQTLRKDFNVQMSSHCTAVETLQSYPRIDAAVGDLHMDGGIAGTIRTAVAVAALGKRFWLRSCLEAGISWSAMCHLGMALPELDRPGQTLINWMESDLICGPRWSVRDGGVIPPEQPGLGVELDLVALEHYHRHYLEVGEMDYFSDP
ncbi:MAG: mandelate racemase/muconate lactonizing enzyme family protein [Halopseudomonas sp.]